MEEISVVNVILEKKKKTERDGRRSKREIKEKSVLLLVM